MPLDANLFSLKVKQIGAELSFSDGNQLLYLANFHNNQWKLLDGQFNQELIYGQISVTSSSNSKNFMIELLDPEEKIQVLSVGKFSWEWCFEFEEVKYAWRRSIVDPLSDRRAYTLYTIRSPDPDWPICHYDGKKESTVQIFDYNLNRLEPELIDKKGLELLILLGLCYFLTPTMLISSLPIPEKLKSNQKLKEKEEKVVEVEENKGKEDSKSKWSVGLFGRS